MVRSSWMTGLILTAAAAAGQPAPDQPSGEQPAVPAAPMALGDGPLRIVISEFTGNVQARQLAEQPWAPISVGQQFDEGVEFRTGVRSVVKFKIQPDSDIT